MQFTKFNLAYILSIFQICMLFGQENVVFNNGPLFNIAGTPNVSRLQNTTIGNTSFAAPANFDDGFRVADDFEILEQTIVETITVYAYQTESDIIQSSLTGLYIQIWDGNPSETGSVVIYGDLESNVLTESAWANTYRDSEINTGDTSRPIMYAKALFNDLILPAGTYWLDFSFQGNKNLSGPWAPPISILDATETGDGLQFNAGLNLWSPFLDAGSSNPQGYPFTIEGQPFLGVLTNNISFSIYPNPTIDIINLKGDFSNNLQIEILNNLGKVINNYKPETLSIDVSHLPSGLYFIRIFNEKVNVVKKLIKQ